MNKAEYEKALEEFLANGGQVQQIPVGKSSPTAGNSAWGNSKARAKPQDISDINIDNLG